MTGSVFLNVIIIAEKMSFVNVVKVADECFKRMAHKYEVRRVGYTLKEKTKSPHIKRELLHWPARRDSNPRSSESESAALSNCATGGYIRVHMHPFFI